MSSYYDRLSAFLDHSVEEQFVRATHRDLILVKQNADALLDAFERYRAPHVDKAEWILKMNDGL